MAKTLRSSFESQEWAAALQFLEGPLKESLARTMGVAGGVVLRDGAKQLAPVGVAEEKAVAQFGGSHRPGALRDSIYLVYRKEISGGSSFSYSVSWNAKKAPHGHLLEFGHWQPYAVIFSVEKGWHTDTSRKLPGQGKWIAAKPFLGPAYDGGIDRAKTAMIAAGREKLPLLLRGST